MKPNRSQDGNVSDVLGAAVDAHSAVRIQDYDTTKHCSKELLQYTETDGERVALWLYTFIVVIP
eukprot:2180735-Pyramimonas_sp.AAC.2